jgi:hypothetical protein
VRHISSTLRSRRPFARSRRCVRSRSPRTRHCLTRGL